MFTDGPLSNADWTDRSPLALGLVPVRSGTDCSFPAGRCRLIQGPFWFLLKIAIFLLGMFGCADRFPGSVRPC